MKKTLLLAHAAAILLSFAVGSSMAQAPSTQPALTEGQIKQVQARANSVNAIVAKHRAKLQSLPSVKEHTLQLATALHQLTDAQLSIAGDYPRLEDLEDAISNGSLIKQAGAVKIKSSSSVKPLVFYPRTPCRIADSRSSTKGRFVAGETRSYAAYSAPGQGGVSGCYWENGGALALTITVTNPANQGYLSLYPVGETPPAATRSSVINYMKGVDIANTTVVGNSLSDGMFATATFEIFSLADADVIVDVVGAYYEDRSSSCYRSVSSWVYISLGQQIAPRAPACNPGYSGRSMECHSNFSNVVSFNAGNTDDGTGYCTFNNTFNATDNVRSDMLCCPN